MNEAKELPKLCDYRNRENEPCYGEISEICDGEYWITFCEGHQAVPFDSGAYVPKDPMRRIIFSQQNSRIRQLETENKTLWDAVYFADNKLKRLEVGEIEIPAERLEYFGNVK